MTLYLKYRPQTLEQLDLSEVRDSLTKIVLSGRIPHAFLFSGPKGTGKTSAARIVAKIVNCEKNEKKFNEPCNVCSQCKSVTAGSNIDVIELDAASNRGIDDIRVIRDSVKLSPASGRKKVYIIDEVHMLTTEASNALLKTLEEPPDHAMFILATTNPEKLIDTIKSRTTHIRFKKASINEIVASLLKKAKGEKVKIDKELLKKIAEVSEGSFRDAAKILEQVLSEKVKLTAEAIERFLQKGVGGSLDVLIKHLFEKDARKAIKIIEKEVASGVIVSDYLGKTIDLFHKSLLAKVGIGEDNLPQFSKDEITFLIKLLSDAYAQTPSSFLEQLPFEVAVITWCEGDKNKESEEISSSKDEDETEKNLSGALEEVEVDGLSEANIKEGDLSQVNADIWKQILSLIKPINSSIEALLRAAKPISYDGKVLTLGVYYKFHKERLEEEKHRCILEEVITKVLTSPTRVACILTQPPPRVYVNPVPEVSLTENAGEDIIEVAKKIFEN